MSLRIWFLNILLLAVFIFFSFQVVGVLSGGDMGPYKKDIPGGKENAPIKRVAGSNIKNRVAYEALASSNIFSPDRSEFIPRDTDTLSEETSDPEGEPVKPLKRNIFLHGVVVMDGYRAAVITNPAAKKGGPANIIVREKDKLDDMTVTAILKDSIHLTRGGETFVVKLFDKKKASRRAVSPNKTGESPRVISVGTKTNTKAKSSKQVRKGSSADKASPSRKDVSPKKKTGEAEYIKTPFGMIKRMIKE